MSSPAPLASPLFIGDHLALDFLNTVAQVEGQPVDFWQRDEDVQTWLAQAGLLATIIPAFNQGELLKEARQLRDIIRTGVAQKKAGQMVMPEKLNHYLALASSHQQLEQDEKGRLRIGRIYGTQSPAQLLAPVVELAASLLAEENFELVRVCEHPECTLWFLDRTKAHRRRWCSMAICGNRAKIARFRQLQR